MIWVDAGLTPLPTVRKVSLRPNGHRGIERRMGSMVDFWFGRRRIYGGSIFSQLIAIRQRIRCEMRTGYLGVRAAIALVCVNAIWTMEAFAFGAQDKRSAVESVATLVEERYVFAEVGKTMADYLRRQLAQGAYEQARDEKTLAGQLTVDLRKISSDKHLNVRHSPEVLPPIEEVLAPSAERLAFHRAMELKRNVGFERVEILPGNIGYLSILYFGDPVAGAPKVAAAMSFLADTEALIIDLRRNPGATAMGLGEHLRRHLLRDDQIKDGRMEWRGLPLAHPPKEELPMTAPRYLDKPVYLLTSGGTFSGAEGFAFDLQAHKRVTIVGEPTGGGAHAGGELRAGDHWAVWVPTGRPVHPLAKGDWEGKGVQPEVRVKSARALAKAHALAIEHAKAKNAKDPGYVEFATMQLKRLDRELSQVDPVVSFVLQGYDSAKEVNVVGTFNGWRVGATPMQREGGKWVAQAESPVGRQMYKFWIDGQWILDPANPETEEENGFMNSVREVSAKSAVEAN